MSGSPPEKLRPWPAFTILAIGVFLSTLDASIVNVALPVIQEDFRAPLHLVGWIPMGYLLTITVTLLTFGRLGDQRGRAGVYRTGLLVFTAASLFCGLVPNVPLLVASRIIQALGASMMMAVGPALLVRIFPENMRGRAVGTMGVAVNIGLTSGPVLGGLITEFLSWRFIFLINLPVGLIGWWLARHLSERDEVGHPQRPVDGSDRLGNLLWLLGLMVLILGMNRLPVWGPVLWPTGTLLLCGGTSLAAFVIVERRVKTPLLPLDIFRRRLFSIPLLGSTVLFIYTFIVVYLGPFYLTYAAGLSVSLVGAFYILGPLGSLITAPASGWLYDRWGSRGLTNIGLAINAVTLFGLTRLGDRPSLLCYGVLMITLGLGNGIFMPPNTSTLLGCAPRRYAGVASGLQATGRNLGMVIGVAVGGAIFEMTWRKGAGGTPLEHFDPARHAPAFADAWRAALWAGLTACVVSLLINFFRGRERLDELSEASGGRATGIGA